ncbi:tectonin beta-propeller repeat-containing protein 1-like [Denticeps clupeoides]|uniref:tectonin beta-propeller repeat-containing protein 1-like n=1 Tax=Denticeps clupeoides TaxID=299321 RepID=UPI0010A516AD|nr:tectonin beta-propeller repeat-containing protein 1-like [Denticeps clupeoides]XP_028844607.1 tectonin beta-propeller repeat-containing protein 1-like [Denticeps clupeoides]XP_028844609.1 tectonin beta-propeller repeat-containing protein 1-like [Denticeps clupeoides]
MPSSLLWAVDVYGRVYSLSTAGQQWERCRDAHLDFKRVSATAQCCWGIAGDNQIYLNVHASDLPIRYQEETYENQRWNPVDGFSDRLLPSDRWQWSDVTGLQHQPLDSFQLLSDNWEWEGDWYVDENFGGDPTDKGGWTYAMDFPATYTKDKKWNSCVRRRRWIRYRRYTARDVWAKVPSGETPSLPDPFNDLSCGSWDISDEPAGRLSLWAVSLQGKVWFRDGICHHNPEGSIWEEVDVPGEVVQISCGPADLVWAVLWEGQLLVREGVGRDCPRGSSWVVVESPSPEVGAVHVAVGVNVVWAITKDHRVWFRRGVNSHNPCGSGWIGMVGEMVMINVGLNDQVWAISCEDRAVCFRQGVTGSELSGKAWKVVSVTRDSDRSHSSASTSSLQSAGCFFGGEVRVQSQGSVLSDADSETERVPVAVAPSDSEPVASDVPKARIPKVTSDSFISELVSDRDGQVGRRDTLTTAPSIPEEEPVEGTGQIKPPTLVLSPSQSGGLQDPQWSNVDLEEAQTLLTAGAVAESSDTCSLSSVATYNLGLEEAYGGEEPALWAWVAGGSCSVDAHSQLNWFGSSAGANSSAQSMSLSITPAQTAVWRKQILEQLTQRSKREVDNFRHYEQAIEQSVWVKKGSMQWWRDWKPHKWVDVRFALEQFCGAEGNKDGILFIYYTFNDEKKYLHAFINEITILVPVLNESKHTFAIYTAERTKQRWPIRLAAATEQEMHDWLALLSVSCCDARGLHGPPSHQAIWSVTCKGDIFVSEPTLSLEVSPYPTPCDQMFWRQVGGHLRLIECNSLGVVWGIGYDHTAWVFTGGYGGGFFQGLASSTDNIFTQTDVKSVHIYENQRWNPVTGYTNRGLPTDRYMWSDATGLQECTKTNTKPPSPHWTWVSDWSVDYGVSGGTDREGWQFAADFPASYHGHKTLKDFVRRRRWARKCKLITTGPWQEVPPISLTDVTILPCRAQCPLDQVHLWAISSKGDVLCRLGVSRHTPAGTSWLHIGADQPFKSISIGAAYQVWAIARDGSAFYRGSVSPQNPAGDCWYHIPSPCRQKLRQVCVGRASVYTVDENGNLWYRQGVTPSYPQGSTWEHVSNNVRKVSVGPLDQVWIIADKVQGSRSLSCGTVCRRLGLLPTEPRGQSWDYGIGGGWDHVTVRANATEAPRTGIPTLSSTRPGSHPAAQMNGGSLSAGERQ